MNQSIFNNSFLSVWLWGTSPQTKCRNLASAFDVPMAQYTSRFDCTVYRSQREVSKVRRPLSSLADGRLAIRQMIHRRNAEKRHSQMGMKLRWNWEDTVKVRLRKASRRSKKHKRRQDGELWSHWGWERRPMRRVVERPWRKYSKSRPLQSIGALAWR